MKYYENVHPKPYFNTIGDMTLNNSFGRRIDNTWNKAKKSNKKCTSKAYYVK